VLRATLEVLGEQLFEEERAQLALELPPELVELLRSQRRLRAHGLRHFFRRVARREGIRIGLGVEHAEVVCRVISECLSEATRGRLRREAPELADLFTRPEEQPSEQPFPSQPLETSERSPRPHRHSIAASDDPHAESRLSSAHGLTQEREGRTLASGHPGSSRPLSGGRG
jgi:uncharacterized protein (DUF2267 family)